MTCPSTLAVSPGTGFELAPYGEAVKARTWAIRAAAEAMQRLAYGEGVRLYRAALELEPASLPDGERCRVQIALGRAAYLAVTCVVA